MPSSSDLQPDSFAGHDGGVWAPESASIVCSWPAGHFVENLAVDETGAIFISIHTHRRVDRYDPGRGTLDLFAELPASVAGLAFDARGTLWAVGGSLGQAPGYVWRLAADGSHEQWAEIPDAVFMNGCAVHPDGRTLLACESVTGRVIAVDLLNRRSRSWITDDLLRPEHDQIPGANGIKVRGQRAWISVTGRDLILSAPILADGSAAGLEVIAKRLRADDFAFAASGAMYVTTHPANTVLRLAADGSRRTVAGPHDGAVGSTACAFGRTLQDSTALYVTTNGGMSAPYRGEIEEAKLLRLEVGEAGQTGAEAS